MEDLEQREGSRMFSNATPLDGQGVFIGNPTLIFRKDKSMFIPSEIQ